MGRAVPRNIVVLTVLALSTAAGCQSTKDVLIAPKQVVAPYDAILGGPLWAVVPLRNESGTTAASSEAMSDKLVAAVEEVQGLRALPLNRTLGAMRALNMREVHSPAEARRLAQALGVDGVIVGAITAYDPYTPTIGITLALYASGDRPASGLDPRALAAAATDTPGGPRWTDRPAAVVSEHLDSKNNQVLMDVKSFAEGRLNGPSAVGWRRYLLSADLYSEFVAYRAVDALMRQEWVRTGRQAAAADGSKAGSK